MKQASLCRVVAMSIVATIGLLATAERIGDGSHSGNNATMKRTQTISMYQSRAITTKQNISMESEHEEDEHGSLGDSETGKKAMVPTKPTESVKTEKMVVAAGQAQPTNQTENVEFAAEAPNGSPNPENIQNPAQISKQSLLDKMSKGSTQDRKSYDPADYPYINQTNETVDDDDTVDDNETNFLQFDSKAVVESNNSNNWPCTDSPAGWADSDGDFCWEYPKYQWCTSSGGYGTRWNSNWGTFRKYSKNGNTAATACCACGGGVRGRPVPAMRKVYVHYATNPWRQLFSLGPACCGWTQQLVFYAFVDEQSNGGDEELDKTWKAYAWEKGHPHRSRIWDHTGQWGWRDQFTFEVWRKPSPGATKYHIWHADRPDRTWLATAPPCCGWGTDRWFKMPFYAYTTKPKTLKYCSDITKIKGEWVYLFKLNLGATITASWGTSSSDTQSSTSSFTKSFEVGVTASAAVEGFGGISVSSSVRSEWGRSFTAERSTSKSEGKQIKRTVPQDRLYHHLWQFVIASREECGNTWKTESQQFAYTKHKLHKPCCAPGHCLDQKEKGSCDECTVGFLINSDRSRCKETAIQ